MNVPAPVQCPAADPQNTVRQFEYTFFVIGGNGFQFPSGIGEFDPFLFQLRDFLPERESIVTGQQEREEQQQNVNDPLFHK